MQKLVITRPLIPSLSKIEDEDERAYYWNRLLTVWGSKQPKLFPGCNPVSVSESNVHLISNGECPYLISLKSDGVRYALFLTMRHTDDVLPVALMIDRSGNMYEVEVVAEESYFKRETVLEGELVWRQPECSEMLFLTFDAICIRGILLKNSPFEERLRRLVECVKWSEDLSHGKNEDIESKALELDTIVMTHYNPRIVVRPKTFVDRMHAERLWSERCKMDHRVDGIVIQRSNSPYEMGTSKAGTSLKWKPESTVDLEGPLGLSSEGTPFETLHEGVIFGRSRIRASEGEIVEYLIRKNEDCHDSPLELFAIRKRTDKKYANGDSVIRATIHDFFNHVTVERIGSVG